MGDPAPYDERFVHDDDDGAATSEDESDVAVALPAALAGALVLASLAWGLIPGLEHAATRAAARFTDTAGYAAAVLGGGAARAVPPSVPRSTAPTRPPGSTRSRRSRGAAGDRRARGLAGRTLPRPAARAVDAVRSLHNGRPGDYVAWVAGGAAALGGLFALTLS